jgi:hypothetical protein
VVVGLFPSKWVRYASAVDATSGGVVYLCILLCLAVIVPVVLAHLLKRGSTVGGCVLLLMCMLAGTGLCEDWCQ